MFGLLFCFGAVRAQGVTGTEALRQKMRQMDSGRDAAAWVITLPPSERDQTGGMLLDLLGGFLSDRKTEPKLKAGVYLENVVAAYASVAEREPLRAMVARLLSGDDAATISRVVSGLAESGGTEPLAALGDWARPLIEKLSPTIPDPVTDVKAMKKLDEHLQPLATAIFQLSRNSSPEGWKLRTELLTALVAKYEGANHGKKTVARLKEELAKTSPSTAAPEQMLDEEMPEEAKGEAEFLVVRAALLIPRSDSQLRQMDLADLKVLMRHTTMNGRSYPMMAIHEIMRRKDREGLEFVVAWAENSENKLPDVMPSLEELTKVEQRRGKFLPQDSWVLNLSNIAVSLMYLEQSASPAGPGAAEKIMADFKKKWGASDSGKTIASLLEQQMEMGRQILQRGQAPWQRENEPVLGEEESK